MAGEPAPAALVVSCRACGDALAAALAPLVRAAAAALGLERDVSVVEICLDDLPAGDDGWLRADRVPGSPRPHLTLYCGRRALAADVYGERPGGPAPFAWESSTAGEEADETPDPAAAAAFLHHQLLLARDLLRGDLVPEALPPALGETFGAAWDVVLDGRLARAGLPGYALEARRARFSRRFSSASVLMPHHWQIFQSLWDGGLTSQGEVLAAVRQLPRL